MKYIKDKVEFINEAKKSKKLNEGQFSWLTQDTGKQIGSERQNTIDVYMYDDKGNKFKERKYDGYGNFGGKDYYDLLANMNGYLDTDVDKMSQRDLRNVGIDLAFGKLKTKDPKKKVLFPALVEDPRFNWKKHDFTDQPESDPDQSWYQEDESWDDEDNDGYSYESATNEATSSLNIANAAVLKADVPLSYAKDYIDSLTKMSKRDKKEFKEYDNFSEDDFIEDVEYNFANESVTEGNRYSVEYSDGIRSSKEFRNESDAIKHAKELSKDKSIQFVSVHKPGMHSTASKEDLIAWYGKGSYWDNVSKKDKEVAELQLENLAVNEARAAAKTLLNSVVKGDAKDVEGIKMSKEMADAYLQWLRMSAYGKKFSTLPFDKLFSASFNWGIERYGKGNSFEAELKTLKDKAKEMKESLTEANSDKAVSMAQKKLDKVMTDLKANLLKFKGANSDKEKETFKSEAGRLTKLRKDAHNNLEQAIQDAYADVELIVIENYDSDQRKDMAAKGLALPDGSFPIKTLEDLKNAIQAYGRAKDHAKAAKFIAKRAKVLGAEDLIPDTEDFQKALKEASFGEIPKFGK